MTIRKTVGEFDTEEVKAINAFIANAPQYFERTDQLHKKFFGNGEPGVDEQLRNAQADIKQILKILESSDPIHTKRRVDEIYALSKAVTNTVIGVLVTAALTGIVLLIRLGPALEAMVKQP